MAAGAIRFLSVALVHRQRLRPVTRETFLAEVTGALPWRGRGMRVVTTQTGHPFSAPLSAGAPGQILDVAVGFETQFLRFLKNKVGHIVGKQFARAIKREPLPRP